MTTTLATRSVRRPRSIDPYVWSHIEPLAPRLGVITVTPELSDYIDEKDLNGDNRRLRAPLLRDMIAIMSEGRFQDLTGGPFLLDEAGRVRGTQHRRRAGQETDTTFRLMVQWDQTEEEIRAANHGGIPWSAANLEGGNLPWKNEREAVARFLLRLDYAKGAVGPSVGWTPEKGLVAALMSDQRIVAAVDAVKDAKESTAISLSNLAAFYATAKDIGRGDPDQFIYGLRTGANLSPGDPVLTLRNFVSRAERRQGHGTKVSVWDTIKGNPWQVQFVILRAWAATLKGKSLGQIQSYSTDPTATSNRTAIVWPGWKPFFE